jgi:hypothetical protein
MKLPLLIIQKQVMNLGWMEKITKRNNEKTIFNDLGSGFVVKTKDMSKNGC